MNKSIAGLYLGLAIVLGMQILQQSQRESFLDLQKSFETIEAQDNAIAPKTLNTIEKTTLNKPVFLSSTQQDEWQAWIKHIIQKELALQLNQHTEKLAQAVDIATKEQSSADAYDSQPEVVTLSKEELLIQEESFATASELLENSIALGEINKQNAREITEHFGSLSVQQQHELLVRYAQAINNGEIEPSNESLIGFFY